MKAAVRYVVRAIQFPENPMNSIKPRKLALSIAAALAMSSVTVTAADKKVDSVRMTWYGITNWHYQIGDVGVILDGESANAALNVASVTKQLSAIRKKGTVEYIVVGHEHGDH